MKNKFEALTAFQSWPKEWQRLCAEFWAESEETQEVRVETKEWALPPLGDPFPHSDPQPQRAAKVTKRRLERWSIAQQEYLVECVNQCDKQKHAAEMFLKRYPGRKVGAVEIKIYNMTDANGVMHVRY